MGQICILMKSLAQPNDTLCSSINAAASVEFSIPTWKLCIIKTP